MRIVNSTIFHDNRKLTQWQCNKKYFLSHLQFPGKKWQNKVLSDKERSTDAAFDAFLPILHVWLNEKQTCLIIQAEGAVKQLVLAAGSVSFGGL